MNQDSGVEAVSLNVDGGMTANALLMQFQADLLDLQVCTCNLHRGAAGCKELVAS